MSRAGDEGKQAAEAKTEQSVAPRSLFRPPQLSEGLLLGRFPEEQVNWYTLIWCFLLHLIVTVGCHLLLALSPYLGAEALADDVATYLWIAYAGLIVYFFIAVPAWRDLNRHKAGAVTTYSLLAYIGVTHGFMIFTFGAFSTPLILVFPADIAVAFVLYRRIGIGFFVWAWGNLVLLVPTALALYGPLPYAPVFQGTEFAPQVSAGKFVVDMAVVVGESLLLLWILLYAGSAQDRLSQTARLLVGTSEELTHLETQANLGQKLSVVAHELRNPLAAVRSILESTLDAAKRDGGRLDEDDLEGMRLAVKEQTRGLDLVASLRNLARAPGLAEERVDLNKVVQDAVRVLGALREPGQAGVQMQLWPEPLWFKGSHAEMMQVALNLARNALDASGPGTHVRLQTMRGAEGGVVLRCTDQGSGIPVELREKVFEPLFTTKGVDRGTGLGLSHSRELVTRRGGRLGLEWSEVGGGSTFRVELPAADAETGQAADG